MDASSRTSRGRRAEDAVADTLQRAGWRLVARNWCCPGGELDLVVQKDSRLRIVEVKYRRSPADSSWGLVSPAQQARIARAAEAFLAAWTGEWSEVALVVAEVSGPLDRVRIQWWDDAFSG
jgi:Holliday junction resolvase-like predicted endonuclease